MDKYKYIKYKNKYKKLKYENGCRVDGMDFIGKFKIESGQIVAKDPAIEIMTGHIFADTMIPVHNGTWNAYVRKIENGQRIGELMICNSMDTMGSDPTGSDPTGSDLTGSDPTGSDLWKFITTVDVDTGQAGFFDIKHFRLDSDVDNKYKSNKIYDDGSDQGSEWYNMCSTITINKTVGIVPYGVISRSGYGDGSYDVFAIKTGDRFSKLVAVFDDTTSPIVAMCKKSPQRCCAAPNESRKILSFNNNSFANIC